MDFLLTRRFTVMLSRRSAVRVSPGLGTTFTTFHMFMESELRELLGIPKEIKFGVMIPIGWPQNDFVKVKRKPIASVIHWDKWSD